MKMTRRSFISTSALTLLACGISPAAHAAETNCLSALWSGGAETALPPKPLTHKVLDVNPFISKEHEKYSSSSSRFFIFSDSSERIGCVLFISVLFSFFLIPRDFTGS